MSGDNPHFYCVFLTVAITDSALGNLARGSSFALGLSYENDVIARQPPVAFMGIRSHGMHAYVPKFSLFTSCMSECLSLFLMFYFYQFNKILPRVVCRCCFNVVQHWWFIVKCWGRESLPIHVRSSLGVSSHCWFSHTHTVGHATRSRRTRCLSLGGLGVKVN